MLGLSGMEQINNGIFTVVLKNEKVNEIYVIDETNFNFSTIYK